MLCTNENGRLRHPYDPHAALLSPSKELASGAKAIWPATNYLLKCQRFYEEFYGARAMAGRSSTPLTLDEVEMDRALASKPRLTPVQKSSDLSMRRQIELHQEGCERAAAAVGSSRDKKLAEMAEESSLVVPSQITVV